MKLIFGNFSDVNDRYESDHEVGRIFFHENYNVGQYLNNDIALVQIKYDQQRKKEI